MMAARLLERQFTIMIITNKKQAIDLLLAQQCVGIFQQHSEWGPRALGNRSMCFDARNPNAKEIVNVIKQREWWRPFAGSILIEHVHNWFDIGTLAESPNMSFAVNARQLARDTIPSIIHEDGTCRIQTVTREQNKHYYDLIKEFFLRTGVPIILNTSLNLAGDALVETLEDAIQTQLPYIYCPS